VVTALTTESGVMVPKPRRGDRIDTARLSDAMAAARKSLERFRAERLKMLVAYAGGHYSENTSPQNVPVNFLSLYVQVFSRALVSKNPRVMLSTWHRPARPTVHAMQDWVNREIERLALAKVFQRSVVDALFGTGVMKVSLATPSDAAMSGWESEAGTPTAAVVDLDDWVFDVYARDMKGADFMGHRYRAPLEVVRNWKLYNSKARKKAQPSDRSEYNAEGDFRATALVRGDYADDTEFEEMVELWEVYLPRHRKVVTMLADEGGKADGEDALLVQDWVGPYCGPYHFLSFMPVPGSPWGKGPLQDVFDLHRSANASFNKLEAQARRLKVVTAVGRGATEDGKALIDAKDGEAKGVSNADQIREVVMGGPHAGLFQYFLAVKDLFNFFSGNLEMMGGLSPQSKTATQDKMLNENSSRTLADMQETTVAFVSDVLKAFGWYWWHDPVSEKEGHYSPSAAPDVVVPRRESLSLPRRMAASWEAVDLKVDPYSLAHQTPASRLAALNQVVQQVLMPMAGLLAQQGIQFDLNAYLKKIAEYLDMPDLPELLSIADPVAPRGGDGGGDAPGPGGETTRNYVRESVSGRTDQGTNKVMQAALLGVKTGGASDGSQPGSGKLY
jgi:hypothetical protein